METRNVHLVMLKLKPDADLAAIKAGAEAMCGATDTVGWLRLEAIDAGHAVIAGSLNDVDGFFPDPAHVAFCDILVPALEEEGGLTVVDFDAPPAAPVPTEQAHFHMAHFRLSEEFAGDAEAAATAAVAAMAAHPAVHWAAFGRNANPRYPNGTTHGLFAIVLDPAGMAEARAAAVAAITPYCVAPPELADFEAARP